jgi:hypothetical protein
MRMRSKTTDEMALREHFTGTSYSKYGSTAPCTVELTRIIIVCMGKVKRPRMLSRGLTLLPGTANT